MFVSLNWLRNYVDLGHLSPQELAEAITKSGIEVDGIEYMAEEIKDVVIGYVETCEEHPNADKLSLCSVDVGEEKLQIICGAPNIRQGQKVAVAKPGAVLPGNVKIKKTKLRGVQSNGMICSMQELGLKEKYLPKEISDGIMVLPDDVLIGESVRPILNLDDVVLELDLTPNRADSLSMLGVAYEVAAILDKSILLPREDVEVSEEDANAYIDVEVEDTELNPYYGAFVIRNIEIKPSPPWIANYLMAAGIRPINNVVDITNFVLLEYGQPLHAFDYDRLESEKILTRRARQGEQLVTLDGKERILSEENLVITNGTDPIALAGVMGGASTEVTEDTTTVLLEAAYFASAAVRKTVRDTGLRSESSTRFEKGVDPNRVKSAGFRASQLLRQYAGGEVLANVVEIDKLDHSEKTVEINLDEINQRLGTTISNQEIVHILNKLRFNFKQNDKNFTVYAPTRRQDIQIFEDMLEEVARIYGYDHLPFTLPFGKSHAGGLTERQRLKRKVKNYLESAGLMETITHSLTSEDNISMLISPEIKATSPNSVELAMPMSEDHKYLRLSLLPELLATLAYNKARNQSDLSYYELGAIFISDENVLREQPDEPLRLAGALTGNWMEQPWQQEKKVVDFYVVKGVLEGLFDYLEIPVTFKQEKLPDMHPGRTATLLLRDKVIGFMGQLHPQIEKDMDLKETYVFDVNMEEVLAAYTNHPTYQEIPKYPSIARDIAFILDEEVVAGEVKEMIEEVGSPLVKNVEIFDVYQGENVPEGKKSIAYSLLYQHPDKTLQDDEVEQSYQEIVEKVNATFNAYVRS
ncbi:phenylalanine--tRNA ligase subunit beta [Virgibacillus sp. NKC19-3]|uniref:phenylalanine--tRNA ligase subunit beta n=1 Tax=Virgibacillus saliphilus TaxID=2831674 RepID=UPI001C9BB992|nr:phenylalanine--tRNA ligase subunit beta [Virgibacillus sp. NKC19-3]MBY7143209.1 phenylalanine--tRNA ligase subunit beta [Virgibacillus sp. NKC19-3]